MWCISAYVVGEAKMTKIFAIYLQASGFPSQSSEYPFECCREQLGRYAICMLSPSRIPLQMLILFLSLCSHWYCAIKGCISFERLRCIDSASFSIIVY